jgi:hypothetical protein
MNNFRILWDNLWDDATLSVGSENPEFPATNTQHRWHTRTWRTSGESGTLIDAEIISDLGEAKDIKAFVIKNHNFSMIESGDELRIQANNVDAWGAPPLDVVLPVTEGQIVRFWNTARSYRYWRIVMTDILNPDGYLEIGRIFLGDFFEFYYHFKTKTKTFSDMSIVKKSDGGQISSDQKNRFRTWEYDFDAIKKEELDDLWDIWREIGLSTDYFICENPEEDELYKYVHYIKNLNDWNFSPRSRDIFRFSMSVEELL